MGKFSECSDPRFTNKHDCLSEAQQPHTHMHLDTHALAHEHPSLANASSAPLAVVLSKLLSSTNASGALRAPREWRNIPTFRYRNFDHLGVAMLSLYEIQQARKKKSTTLTHPFAACSHAPNLWGIRHAPP